MRAHRSLQILRIGLLVLLPMALAPAAGQTPPLEAATPPEPISTQRTAQDYPWESVQRNEQGVVGVQYVVDENGDVSQCTVDQSSGFVRLDQAACPIVRRWKFKPAMKEGRPTSFTFSDGIPFFLGAIVTPGDIETENLYLNDPGPEDKEPGDPSFDLQGLPQQPASDSLNLGDPLKDGLFKRR